MIRAVRCDRPSFHAVTFQPGFNVILADRTKEETKKQTRNGLGKSTLIEVIHFCLGSSYTRSPLAADDLAGWKFTMDFSLGRSEYSVTRQTGRNHRRVLLEGELDKREMTVDEWNEWLGTRMFGLPAGQSEKYRPQFRSLISYFARRGKDAYTLPTEHHRKQSVADVQVHNSFLLGLESQDAVDFQKLKDKREALRQFRRITEGGAPIPDTAGTRGELEALKVRLEGQARGEEQQLTDFRVHPQYEDIANQANRLTEEIHGLVNQNVVDKRLLELYEKSSREEEDAGSELDVALVYQEAGVALPGVAIRRLEDVSKFNRTLLENRRAFLQSEMQRLEADIAGRTAQIEAKTAERAAHMDILRTHGALEEYSRLQARHVETLSRLEAVKRRIADLARTEEGESALKVEHELLLQRARRDLAERAAQRNRAIDLFNSYSEALYHAPGTLAIDVDETGFRFVTRIERAGSSGIENMKVFCYDLMLARLWAGRPASPGFLIHDSLIFDGVDERQVALALELAHREAEAAGFQYICALNSDTTPWQEFSPGFDLRSFVRLTLDDRNESNCLMGVRFTARGARP